MQRHSSGRVAWLVVVALMTLGCSGDDPSAGASEPPRRVGLLRVVPDEDHGVFVEELRLRGWRPGTDLQLIPEDPDTLYPTVDEAREAVRAWVRADVSVIVAFSTPFAEIVAEEAPDTPGLFLVNDPLGAGLVDDLDRPGGSLTGVTFRTPADRTLDLATKLLGDVGRVGYLMPSGDPGVPGHQRAVAEAADELGLELVEASFDDHASVADAVAELADADVEVVFLANSTTTVQAIEPIETELDRRGLPAVANTDFAGFAVLVLTPDGAELRRQLARQAARLLAGAPVSAVPVEAPRKFVVIVNRTKLAELGLPDVDAELLRQVDVVR